MTPRRPDLERRRVLGLGAAGLTAAIAGCSGGTPSTPTPGGEATVTVELRNRDSVAREFEVMVSGGERTTDRFSGVLPADSEQPVRMVATLRVGPGQYDLSIQSAGGQVGRTWDPTECRDLLVEASIEDGDPSFEAICQAE